MIAAMSRNRVIGKEKDLPWYLPDDFAYFKRKTRNHPVIMGRKNFESLPHKFRPLPERTNIILTRKKDFSAKGTFVFDHWEQALELARSRDKQEIFIIGGGEIYRQGLKFANRIYLTEIDTTIEGDTFFPEFDQEEWVETKRTHHPVDEKHPFAFDFVIYDKT
jgi:dihydrofolate reductase